MTFSKLTRGNTFGSRVLIPFEHYAKLLVNHFGHKVMERFYPLGCDRELIDDEKEEDYHTKSLLSIIADSAKVEVWILDTSDIGYLS